MGGIPEWRASFIKGKDDDAVTEAIDDAIDDLIVADLVVERTHAHTGERQIGLKNLVDAHEAPYEELKGRVYTRAKHMAFGRSGGQMKVGVL